jgi:hypothetical protein
MVNNGKRVNCYCSAHRCQGKEVDWRTRDAHGIKDADNRPLYREPAAPRPPGEEKFDGDNPSGIPEALQHQMPYQSVPMEDVVSHVDTLPNCNEPVYETVLVFSLPFCAYNALLMCVLL